MLIPVTFKNNDTETVKTKVGKVSTQTARMLYANTFSDKVGIVKGYKKDDDTEELSLIESATQSVGNELVLTFNKGAVSIYGGIGIIEQGTTVNVPQNITDYSFGIVVNLGNQAGSEMKFYCKPSGELRQDDLQINDVDGIYEFELFKITTTASTASTSSKTTKYIYSVKDYVEGRLKDVGFKQGSIALEAGYTATTNSLNLIATPTKSIVAGTLILQNIRIYLEAKSNILSKTIILGTLSNEFRPKEVVTAGSYAKIAFNSNSAYSHAEITPQVNIYENGKIEIYIESRGSGYSGSSAGNFQIDDITINFGYQI